MVGGMAAELPTGTEILRIRCRKPSVAAGCRTAPPLQQRASPPSPPKGLAMPRSPLPFRLAVGLLLLFGLSLAPAGDEEQDKLKVGVQPDGRILVPTNQILSPAGKQLTFPGRPVDLALADEKTLVIKNMRDLVFVDLAEGKV